MQRVVNPRRREQAQRLGLTGARLVCAVGNAVVHGRQVWQVKHISHQLAAFSGQAAFNVVMLGKRKMHWDGLRAGPYLQFNTMVFKQQCELL